MKISASLVSHYRKIFDTHVQGLNLSVDELKLFNNAFGENLKSIINNDTAADSSPERKKAFQLINRPLVAAASAVAYRR
jgi:hypothetical protein